MRYLVISDIHANLTALNAVLADAGDYDHVWCLGDITGYGPEPNECIERLRELPLTSLAGNHDWAVLGKLDLEDFNQDAHMVCLWTRDHLTPENRDFLAALPVLLEEDGYTLVHGSPSEPVEEYVLDILTASYNFERFNTPVCLLGHSHWPVAFMQPTDSSGLCAHIRMQPFQPLHFNSGRWMVNPGSVGQPRDSNPQAAYAILDTDQGVWEYRRVTYPVEETQSLMRKYRFPARLIERLSHGH